MVLFVCFALFVSFGFQRGDVVFKSLTTSNRGVHSCSLRLHEKSTSKRMSAVDDFFDKFA